MAAPIKPVIQEQPMTPPLSVDEQIQRTFELARALSTRKPAKAIEKFRETIHLLGTADNFLAHPHRFVTLAQCRVKVAELSPANVALRLVVKEELGQILEFAIQATNGSPCRQAIVLRISKIKTDFDRVCGIGIKA